MTERPKQIQNSTSNLRVLVVDDLRVNFLLIKAMLSRLRAEVYWSSNGYDAVGLIEEGQHFDLILLDYNMPGIDGMETAKRIKNITKRIPVISMSTFTESPAFDRTNAPFDGYLGKPVDSEELFKIIYDKSETLN